MPRSTRNGGFFDTAPGTSPEVLRERVAANERATLSLQGEVHEIRSTMATQEDVRGLTNQLTNMSRDFRGAMDGVFTKIDAQATALAASGKTDWKGLAPWAMFLLILGGALYWPINQTTARLERDVAALQTALVPRVEHEREWRRAEVALADAKAKAEKNQDLLITKEVFGQTANNLQRQIEEIRKDVGGVVTTRDVLQDQSKKIERLETRLQVMDRASTGANGR